MTKTKWYKIASESNGAKLAQGPCDGQKKFELLQEEMRWVTCYLRWHATWWNKKIVECTLGTAADNEV
ncbi:hypothetical protein DFH29DRAFT_999217 [Suillus ampliporus]|nr:hypothetical protein DFH29DRAFT_999217 [Suillus ampliporus]